MPLIDFQEVRILVPITRALDALGWQEVCRYVGYQLRGQCPIHGSTNPRSRSFAVHTRLNRWFCHSCKRRGDVIDLWALMNGLSIAEAARELCDLVGVAVPTRRGTEKRNG